MDKQYKPDRLNPFFKIALRTSFATRLVVFCLFFSYFVLIFDYFLHQNLAKTCKYFWELNSRLAFWCKLKKTIFLINFVPNLLLFCIFSAFFYKNAENDYFKQHLGCTGPKRWMKYSTDVTLMILVFLSWKVNLSGLATNWNWMITKMSFTKKRVLQSLTAFLWNQTQFIICLDVFYPQETCFSLLNLFIKHIWKNTIDTD